MGGNRRFPAQTGRHRNQQLPWSPRPGLLALSHLLSPLTLQAGDVAAASRGYGGSGEAGLRWVAGAAVARRPLVLAVRLGLPQLSYPAGLPQLQKPGSLVDHGHALVRHAGPAAPAEAAPCRAASASSAAAHAEGTHGTAAGLPCVRCQQFGPGVPDFNSSVSCWLWQAWTCQPPCA